MIGVGFFGLFFVLGIGSLVLSIMTAVNASKYPDWAFQQAGTSKFVWQILPIILIFVCGIAGGVLGIIWYSGTRDQVERAARAGGSPYGYAPPLQPQGYGAPPPNWGPPPATGGWSPPQSSGPPAAHPPPTAPPPGYPPPEQPPPASSPPSQPQGYPPPQPPTESPQ